jgi:aspartate-semialdehyde dehydrogenase
MPLGNRSIRLGSEKEMVAVVGGDTLLAREILERLGESAPAPRVQLISAAPAAATLVLDAALAVEEGEEAVVMMPLVAESLEGSRVAFLAGSPASSRRTRKLNPADGPMLIDLTGALEEQPNARLRAPTAEASRPAASNIHVIAHPAAIAVTMLLAPLSRIATIRRAIVHVFEPASEQGQRGLDELRQQTVAVLSFQKLKTDVYDAQAAFNMLARYGDEALEPLDSIEQRLERHLASLLAAYPSIPMPSLRLIQAPVFHGHSFSVWVEFEEGPSVAVIARSLEEAGLDVRLDEPPNNVGVVSSDGLSVGAIVEDRNHNRACWFWMAADNLRLAADNAVAVATELR